MMLEKYLYCLSGIMWRESLRFIQQRERFIAALIRPLVWLFIFAAGFRSVLGVSIIPPYETYVLYEEYITPGLIGMILLFSGMQTSLSMVYDREMGSMRLLLMSPLPRWFLLFSKLLGGAFISTFQVYTFLLIAWIWGIQTPVNGYFLLWPMLIVCALMLGSLGLFLSSVIHQLENFAGIMNFVIFPMFFTSSALYPLWRIQESSELLYQIAHLNPFTHAVELIRFGLYGQLDVHSLIWVLSTTVVFFGCAIYGYNPVNNIITRKRSA